MTKKVKGGSWVQCPETGKLIPKDEYYRRGPDAPTIIGDIEAFKSPIDGSEITGRAALRAHNKRHGVTDMRDYGDNYFERKAKERDADRQGTTARAKQERIDTLNRAYDQLKSRG